jgi:hypothetical protein
MNKFLVSAILIVFFTTTYGQTISVTKQTEKVKGDNMDVYAITLDGKKEEISSAWSKYLKETGKIKLFSNPMIVSEPIMNGTTYTGKSFYADANRKNETSSTVWAGINAKEWDEGEVDNVNRGLEKLVYQFGVSFYRQKAQQQIDESQQALDAVEKQQQRALNQNKDLTLKLSNNEQEKIKLEKALENNKLENAALKIKIENNVKSQDSLANVSIQVKKVLETHKENQKKIN